MCLDKGVATLGVGSTCLYLFPSTLAGQDPG